MKFEMPYCQYRYSLSLPSWERGLKFVFVCQCTFNILVAPFVGAWIEILLNKALKSALGVAPFVGAWIEILVYVIVTPCEMRRSLRGSVD